MSRAMGVIAGLVLVIGWAAGQTGTTRPAMGDVSIIINLYQLPREEVVRPAIDALAPLVRPGDVFNLVTGNGKGQADLELLAKWANDLHGRFPATEIWVLTSGISNVKLLAGARAKIPGCVSTIVYDYEPNWENEPEFDWDFGKTMASFKEAARVAHERKFKLVGAPTGRPLFSPAMQRHDWDYGRLARESGADGMLVQTQGAAKKSMETFVSAIERLRKEQISAGLSVEAVYPQVTIDLKATNGVPVEQALACVREAKGAGFTRVSLWFASQRVEDAVAFLGGLRNGER